MVKVQFSGWEEALDLGRLEEENGRMEHAEKAYLKALRVNPEFNSLEREFARFLERLGRIKEAMAHLQRAMKLGWPRDEGEAAMVRLREKAAPRPLDRPRILITRANATAGRLEEAARILETTNGKALEGALHEWPDIFSALLCARKYRAAFHLADTMLQKSVRLTSANGFLWPWWAKVSSRGSNAKIKFCISELKHVTKAAMSGEFPGWFAYCRGVLLISLGQDEEALAEYERIKSLRSARHSLMHHPFVMNRLLARDFKWTIDNCRDLLKHVPEYWWFQCRMAEAYMASGDVKRGLEEFELAAAGASVVWARQSIVTWHGAALLWAGEYRRAVAKLDEAAGLGTKIWFNCWRGGAYLMMGKHLKALADFDQAIKTDPQDLEAHLWRGEAYRLLGRNAEALRDLDRALELDGKYTWAYFNRALVRGAMGDAKGMADDFKMIPEDIIAAIRGTSKAVDPGRAEMRRILEAGLKRAKGNRRPEHYLNSIWMGRGKPAARGARG